jgi:hypothetical protein
MRLKTGRGIARFCKYFISQKIGLNLQRKRSHCMQEIAFNKNEYFRERLNK